MRALIVADLHYSLRQFDWLLRVAAGYDMVIVAGDLLDIAGRADLDTQIVVVSKYLARLAAVTRVVVCSGNHDADERDAADESVVGWFADVRADGVHVDGEHLALAPGMITICPWSDGPASRAALEDMLAAARRPDAGPWIWIHHVPPNRTAVSWTGRDHAGDEFLRDLIARFAPDFVVSGHVHSSPFRRGGSWVDRLGGAHVVNPGRQLGELPAYVELDLGAGTLAWMSLAGDGLVRMASAELPP
jgi:Icc-related predicted phosphoesterase